MRVEKEQSGHHRIAICTLLLLATLGRAQDVTEYEIEGENGRILYSEMPTIEWQVDAGVWGTHTLLESNLGMDRVQLIQWTGTGRRFFVTGYNIQPTHPESVLLLLEFSRQPAAMQELARLEPSFDLEHVAYDSATNQLYVLSKVHSMIRVAEFDAAKNELPTEKALVEVLDGTKVPMLGSQWLDQIAIFHGKASSGLLAWGNGTGSERVAWDTAFMFLKEDAGWLPMNLGDLSNDMFGPGRETVATKGRLNCFAPSRSYRLMRLDLRDEPREVIRGSWPAETEAVDLEILSFPLPERALVAGARYAILPEAMADEYRSGGWPLGSGPEVQEFTAVVRHGRAYEPDSLRIGSLVPLGRSSLGNASYKLRISVGAIGPEWWDRTAQCRLYWAVGDDEIPESVVEAERVTLIDALGSSEVVAPDFEMKAIKELELHLPLNDKRMQDSGFLYLQAMVWSGDEVAVSDVVVTSMFASEGAATAKLVDGERLPKEAQARWEEAKKRLIGRAP